MTLNCLNGFMWDKYSTSSSCLVSPVGVIYSPELSQNCPSWPFPFTGIYFQHGSWNETVWKGIPSRCSGPTCGSTISELLERENAQIQASRALQDLDFYECLTLTPVHPASLSSSLLGTRPESDPLCCEGLFCPRWDVWQHPATTVADRFTSEFYFSMIFPGTSSLENPFQLELPARRHLLPLLLAVFSPTRSPLLKLD